MKTAAAKSRRAALAVLAVGILLHAEEGRAQVPDFSLPEHPALGSEEKGEKEEVKSYKSKVAFSWEASRRFSEHVIEEYQPKLVAFLKKPAPTLSDEQAWNSTCGNLALAWEESRSHSKTGTMPADQDEWEKQHRKFLQGLVNDGRRLLSWKGIEAGKAADLQKSADGASSRFSEIQKELAAVEPAWKSAAAWAASAPEKWSKAKLEEARAAFASLKDAKWRASAACGSASQAYTYAKETHASKPSIDVNPTEKAILKRWRSAVADYPKVQKIYTEPVAEWAKFAEEGFLARQKAWESMQSAFTPATSRSLVKDSMCSACASSAAECIQNTLDRLARIIVGGGTVVELTKEQEDEDKELSKKERARYLELIRVSDPQRESKLQWAVEFGETEAERKKAEKELREYRDAEKKAFEESAKVQETHRARKKKLGLPPDDWAQDAWG